MIVFSCPVCRRLFHVDASQAGKEVRCPGCGQVSALPAVESSATQNPTDTSPATEAPSSPAPPEAVASWASTAVLQRPPEQPPPSPAPQVPGYEILGELGRGSMGVVYKARDRKLKRLVALKMILAGGHAGPAELARFRTEAEALARLRHPGIVQIYEVGEAEGRPYLSLEFCEGGSLRDWLDGTPLPPAQAADLVRTLALAMEAAHQAGVVHRDLKPANVLVGQAIHPGSSEDVRLESLTYRGVRLESLTCRITDFGLARWLDEGESTDAQRAGMTRSGAVLGTPSYMAPEQAGGATPAGAAADVWALGAILYELLTGRPPFRGTTSLETLEQVRSQEPVPPTRLQPHVPRDLENICLLCLRKEPGQRYASARHLADDLGRFLRGEPVLARPVSAVQRLVKWVRRRPAVAGLLAALVLALLGGLGGMTGLWLHAEGQRDRAEAARSDAEEQGDIAREALAEVERQRRSAERARDQLAEQVVHLHVANGVRLLDEGDNFAAALWFADALSRQSGNPERAALQRQRIRAALQSAPRLVQAWFHEDKVHHAAFSPDGAHVATAGGDGIVRLWEVGTGRAVRALKHGGGVNYLEYNRDGSRLVTSSTDRFARVWDTTTGRHVAELRHDELVLHATLAPDGRHLATVCWDRAARIWDLATGKLVGSPLRQKGHFLWRARFSADGRRLLTTSLTGGDAQLWEPATGRLVGKLANLFGARAATFSPDGKRVLVAGNDGVARFWDAVTGQALPLTLRHSLPLTSAAFSPDGRRVVTAGSDGTARVWDAASGAALSPPLPHTSEVEKAGFSPDGQRVLTVSADRTVRLWDAATGQPVTPLLRHGDKVQHAAFSPDGRLVLTACHDRAARVWDLAAGLGPGINLSHDQTVLFAALGAGGRRLVTCGQDGIARAWDARTGQPLSPPVRHRGPVWYGAFSPDGQRIVTGSGPFGKPGEARVWETTTGKLAFAPLQHDRHVNRVAFSPDSKLLLTTSMQSVHLWSAATGQPVRQPLRPAGLVNHAAFSPDGRRFVVAALYPWAQVYDTATGKAVSPILAHTNQGHHAVFSTDGRWVLTASADHTARIWDAVTGKPVSPPLAHGDTVVFAAFSPDGRRVVTASHDRTARIWAVPGGTAVTQPLRHQGRLTRAVFSPDGKLVATSSEDQTVRLWEPATGQAVSPAWRHEAAVKLAVFTPGGDRVLTVAGTTVRLRELPGAAPGSTDLEGLAQLLACHRLHASNGLVPLGPAGFRAAWEKLRPAEPSAFTVSQGEVLAWHERESRQCAQRQEWAGAAIHLDRLMTAARPSWAARVRWATAQAELGHWKRAAAGFSQALAERDDPELRKWQAVAQLACGERQAYRAWCATQAEQLSGLEQAGRLGDALWRCALVPAAVADYEAVLAAARERVRKKPRSNDDINTLAALLFRAGRLEEARKQMQEAIAVNGGKGTVFDFLFLALIDGSLGQKEQARRWLDTAGRLIEQAGRGRRLSWDQRLQLRLLRQEAEALVRRLEP